jgi:hypothetical protein
MLEKSMEQLIWFGTPLRYLQDVQQGYGIKGTEDGWMVFENVTGFLNHLEELGFVVTSRASASYRSKKLKEELAESSEHALSGEQAKRLGRIMTEIRTTLEAEARGCIASCHLIAPRMDVDIRPSSYPRSRGSRSSRSQEFGLRFAAMSR